MRWDELFAELEAEFSASAHQESEAEITDMMHAEIATLSFVDRIRHRFGEELNLRLRNGEVRRGRVNDVTNAWVMLHEGHRRYLIPYAAIAAAWPLGGAASPASGVAAKITLGNALRALARGGVDVGVVTDGAALRGRLGKVGSDFVDVHAERAVLTVAWSALLSVEA